jgi:two-component system NtrC family sensor kinase
MQHTPGGVRSHILLTVIGVVVVGFAIVYAVITPLLRNTLRNERQNQSVWLAETIAADLAASLEAESGTETASADEFEAHLKKWSESLVGVCLGVTDAGGQLYAESANRLSRCAAEPDILAFLAAPDAHRWTDADDLRAGLLLSVPLTLPALDYGPGEGSRLVYAAVTDNLGQRLRVTRTLLFWSMVLAVFLVTLIGYGALTQLISRPLNRLGRAIGRLQTGDLSARAEPSGGVEIRELAEAFNALTRKLTEDESRIAHQISELKLMNERLEQARDHLVRSEKLASVGTLAAGVAHEIGNPLSIALGYLEVLARPDVTEDERLLFVEQATEATHRVDHIIRDLLDFSRPAEEDETGDTVHAVEQSLQLLAPQKRFKDVSVQTRVPAGPLSAAIGEQRLQQVLINLLLNAADAMGSTDRPAEIGVVLREGTDSAGCAAIIIEVSDNGPGITAAVRSHIFDPFFTTKPPGSGTGLGLSICYNIVTAIGGDITVNSRVGEGTTFTLTLPRP